MITGDKWDLFSCDYGIVLMSHLRLFDSPKSLDWASHFENVFKYEALYFPATMDSYELEACLTFLSLYIHMYWVSHLKYVSSYEGPYISLQPWKGMNGSFNPIWLTYISPRVFQYILNFKWFKSQSDLDKRFVHLKPSECSVYTWTHLLKSGS